MVLVLFIAGNQVPVMPLVEVVGNADKDAPMQSAATCVNTEGVGVIGVQVVPVVTPPTATKLELVPVSAKLFNVALLLLLVASVKIVTTVLLLLATP